MSFTQAAPLYAPLAPSEIRLLNLFPGEAEDPIRCSFEHIFLDIGHERPRPMPWRSKQELLRKRRKWYRLVLERPNGLSYQALSYCWGSDKIHQYIYVGGQRVPIRQNLWSALRYLRYPKKETRVLWIDALCINQADFLERAAQVSIMAYIFQKASLVLVWLGEVIGNAHVKLGDFNRSLLKQMKRDYENAAKHDGSLAQANLRWGIYTRHIQYICQNPYWGRLWIIQEVLMANELRLCLGPELVSWETFLEWVEYKPLETQRGWHFDIPFDSLLELFKMGGGSMVSVIRHSRDFQCQDVRDKVYGLLGLIQIPAHRLPKVDYSRTAQELYFDLSTLYFAGSAVAEGDAALRFSHFLQKSLNQPFPDCFSDENEGSSSPALETCFAMKVEFKDYVAALGPLLRPERVTGKNYIKWIRVSNVNQGYMDIELPIEDDSGLLRIRDIVAVPPYGITTASELEMPHDRNPSCHPPLKLPEIWPTVRLFMSGDGRFLLGPAGVRNGDRICRMAPDLKRFRPQSAWQVLFRVDGTQTHAIGRATIYSSRMIVRGKRDT